MMYRLWRYDVFRYAQNDVARFTRNDAMFALMARRHTSLGAAVIIGVANIICRRQTSLKKDQVFRLGLFSGWGAGIRTPVMSESESDALPLGDTPIFSTLIL